MSTLLHDAAPTTALIDGLVKRNAAATGVLLSNLATFSSIQAANIPAFRALLVAVPQTGKLVPLVVRNGAIQAGALFNYTQPVCSYGTPLPSPLSPTRAAVAAVGCSHVVAGELARGAANAPHSGSLVTQSGAVITARLGRRPECSAGCQLMDVPYLVGDRRLSMADHQLTVEGAGVTEPKGTEPDVVQADPQTELAPADVAPAAPKPKKKKKKKKGKKPAPPPRRAVTWPRVVVAAVLVALLVAAAVLVTRTVHDRRINQARSSALSAAQRYARRLRHL